MKLPFQRRISSLRDSFPARRRSRTTRRRFDAEVLEDRALLDVTLAPIVAAEIGAGKDLYIPLTAVDDDGSDVEFNVISDNSSVFTEVITGGRSLRLNVTVTDQGDGTSFTGDITLRLFEDKAPIATARIIELVEEGFYDVENDIIFHRVIDDFVAQFGDPTGTGTSGSGVEFPDEFDPSLTFSSPGLLAMANSGDDVNDSQMFIVDTDISLFELPQHLNFNHTILGIMTSGRDTLAAVMGTPTDASSKPVLDVTLNTIDVFEDNQNGVLRVLSEDSFLGTVNLTVSANSSTAGNIAEQEFPVTVVSETIQDSPYLEIISRSFDETTNTLTLTVTGTDLDNDELEFVVRDASFSGAPADVTVDIDTDQSPTTGATATITIKAEAGYTGAGITVGVHEVGTGIVNGVDRETIFDTDRLSELPTADAQAVRTAIDTPVAITLTGDDGDVRSSEELRFLIESQPTNGTISDFNETTGTLTYTPNPGFTGSDSFVMAVSDQFLGVVDVLPRDPGTDNRLSGSATVSINVSAVAAPINLVLVATSDNGVSDSDNYTSAESWEITLTATPGAVVNVLVNDTTTQATEASAGEYRVTIPRENLVVGVNSISAEATLDGDTSSSATALDVTFAPEMKGSYYVPGTFGVTQTLSVEWIARLGNSNNELGVYVVDDAAGRVNGLLPSDEGYAQAALIRATSQVLFASGSGEGDANVVSLVGGQRVGFYLISNTSKATFLKLNPTNGERFAVFSAFFSFAAANPRGDQHVQTVADAVNGSLLMGWDDQLRHGDQDFNDAVITIQSLDNPTVDVGEAIRIPGGSTASIDVDFRLSPTGPYAPGRLAGELGVFPVDDIEGSVNGVSPGDFDYLDEVHEVAQTIFSDELVGAAGSLSLDGGLYGFYYAPGMSLEDVEIENPENDPEVGDVVLFSFDTANPGNTEHFRLFGPDGRSARAMNPHTRLDVDLHIMDKLFGGSSSFDDFLLSIRA